MAVTERAETPDATPGGHGLAPEQLAEYHELGFTVVRDAIDEADLQRFAAAALRHPPNDQVVPGQTWPGPGRYTLARNAMADPDLAFIMARPEIVEPMRSALDDDPKVMMFAYYDRTPGGPGIPPHNDYKRWRPIGSSMRWAFAIVPLCDFDEAAGKLEFAPGSHRVAHRPDPIAPVLNADRPDQARRRRLRGPRAAAGRPRHRQHAHLAPGGAQQLRPPPHRPVHEVGGRLPPARHRLVPLQRRRAPGAGPGRLPCPGGLVRPADRDHPGGARAAAAGRIRGAAGGGRRQAVAAGRARRG